MVTITLHKVHILPMVTKEGLQRLDLEYTCSRSCHLILEVFRGETPVLRENIALLGGKGRRAVLLPEPEEDFEALFQLTDREGNILSRLETLWTRARRRTMYVVLSSHMDIGLHESQYIQRKHSADLVDGAKKCCDETAHRPAEDRYRCMLEGSWAWNNYAPERGEEAAREIIEDYIKQDRIGLGCGIAGNHFQTFGLEELCRSAYERRRLKEKWGVEGATLFAIDINGLPVSMIQPYAEAGVKNLIFAPNHWNPLPSTVWPMDMTDPGCYLNPNASGGGTRVDVRYDSDLPMVFYWEGIGGQRLLVWASTQYGYGATPFGLEPGMKLVPETVPRMEAAMAKSLPLLEEKYPYDVWLMCCYTDNQDPDLEVTNSIQAWNAKWAWPKLRTTANPDKVFQTLREKHDHLIPVLRGEMTGGWYQHPLSAPELLAQKFQTDRNLSTAEKWSAVAASLDENYGYPAEDFRRAWDHLLFNDEHSYGTSGYQGRRVYETWLQHRDWIDRAEATARKEGSAALKSIAGKIAATEHGLALFNPTAQSRETAVYTEDGRYALAKVPPFGYRVVKDSQLLPFEKAEEHPQEPPVIENRYYKISFEETGAIRSIIDKEEGRELLDPDSPFRCNQPVYTRDNHKTFLTPQKAAFSLLREEGRTTVTATTKIGPLGARIIQKISLPNHEKRIDLDNKLLHARDMFNRCRYYRYLYFAFPFKVEKARRYCHLNGTVAEYAVDVTGHGTDTYMAANEWCCAENSDWGVALMMADSQLVEFDHIHPDKTDFGDAGDGSQMYAYVANDWLQMHCSGGSHLDFRFRYAITSYRGSHREAGIAKMAERYLYPVEAVPLSPGEGCLSADAHSFLTLESGHRLVGLKRAEDGNGLIARLLGEGRPSFGEAYTRTGIDERPGQNPDAPWEGFITCRIREDLRLTERPAGKPCGENGAPAPIGSVYTGLVGEPCAAAGEHQGHLYLEWGRSYEEDLSHYELYRSEDSDFEASPETFVTEVLQEPEYAVGRYSDTGLKEHTRYYYRVRAVNKAGQKSPLSREFSAWTRERTDD